MGVDADRQATARARRAAIIHSLNAGFNLTDPDSPASRFKHMCSGPPRLVVANADIDGVVSAQLLCSVTGWPIAALIDRRGNVRVHPEFADPDALIATGNVFGVDVFSPLFPNVSNHPVHFGPASRGWPSTTREPLVAFDTAMTTSLENHGTVNLSAWVRIAATGGSSREDGIPYKYPLGSSQVMLALLEVVGRNPKLYDRQYLPWIIANCDGGLETIRTYAWNAETWWSALAATVGPSSLSEALYRLATEQRPNEAVDVDRRLRYDEPQRSASLNTKWNIADSAAATLAVVVGLIGDLSGWPDPFLGGVDKLSTWSDHTMTARALPVTGLTKADPDVVQAHLGAAAAALHVNFSVFRERGTALGWMLPRRDTLIEAAISGEPPEEDIPADEPSIPDQG